MLEPLGLSVGEEIAYAWLVDSGPVTLADLADCLPEGHTAATDLEVLVAGLQSKGLVSRLPGQPDRIVACAPENTLERLALQQEEALHQARVQIRELQDRYRLAPRHEGSRQELVEIVHGREAIAARTALLLDSARDEFRGFDKPPYFDDPHGLNPAEFRMLARGIRCRCIYDRSSLMEVPDYLEIIEKLIAAGEEARILDVPMKLGIADRQLALLPLEPDLSRPKAELFVRASALLEALIELFEMFWERAEPLHLDSVIGNPGDCQQDGPAEDDRRLLQLLAAGLTDDAIGHQLHISQRTLQRRLRDLQRRLDAPTRFQLAVHACRSGWLPPPRQGEQA
jgi:DNA-binding CsgD family transcriptional regulator